RTPLPDPPPLSNTDFLACCWPAWSTGVSPKVIRISTPADPGRPQMKKQEVATLHFAQGHKSFQPADSGQPERPLSMDEEWGQHPGSKSDTNRLFRFYHAFISVHPRPSVVSRSFTAPSFEARRRRQTSPSPAHHGNWPSSCALWP